MPPPSATETDPAPEQEVTPLTLEERRRGRRYFVGYAVFNSISYASLAEAIVILALLRLGGGPVWVGAVSSLLYASLPFMVVGYRITARWGVSRNAGWCWGVRSLFAAFMIASPWAAERWGMEAGLWFMFVGALGFFVARAGGMVSFTGIISELTTERDKGELIGLSFRIAQGGGLVVTVLMAVFLGPDSHLYRYQLFFALGLVTGLGSALSLLKIPESGRFRGGPPLNLRKELDWLTATAGRRWFFAMMVSIPLTQGVSRMFVVLVAKDGYGLSDQQTIGLVILSMLGGIAASYTYGFFLDKLGSRPLLVLTSVLDTLAVAGVVILPTTISWPLLGLVFFFNGYPNIAFQACIQHYFISITREDNRLAQGILTQAIGGVAGGVALYAAGFALAGAQTVTGGAADPLLPFRLFFGGLVVLLVVRTIILTRIPRLRSHRVRDALNALLSPWDWRAIHAVRRAVASQREDEETRSLNLIVRSGSNIFREELESFLDSPSFAVRERALEALALVRPSPSLVQALLRDLEENHHTTAPLAAVRLGRWHVTEAIPALRNALSSPDLQVRGRALQALVELGDQHALPLASAQWAEATSALFIIEAARAFTLWGGPEVYGQLLEKMEGEIPPQAKDELSLAVARLMGLYDPFYRDVGMLRREPVQLFTEWRRRYGGGDSEGLVQAARRRSTHREQLLAALHRKWEEYQLWFSAPTAAFLGDRTTELDPALAFLFTFLLLETTGEHLAAADA